MKAAAIFTLVLATISVAQNTGIDHEPTSLIQNGEQAPIPSPITPLVGGAIQIKRDSEGIEPSSSSSFNSEPTSVSDILAGTIEPHGRKESSNSSSSEEASSNDMQDQKEQHSSNKNDSSSSASTSSSTSASSSPDNISSLSQSHEKHSDSSFSSSFKPDASQSQSENSPAVSASAHCNTNDETMCDSSSSGKFFKCVDNKWVSMACSAGNECRTVKNEAVCMSTDDPTSSDSETSDETGISCDTLNSTMCDSDVKSNFFMCIDYSWIKMQCDDSNVCMERGGKTGCVDEQTANTPLESCDTADATQCIDGFPQMFQICKDNYWTNSTCGKETYCLQRGKNSACVDKATAEAPVLPCSTANATRCIDGEDSVFQICYDNFWSNSTCDKDYVCGIKQGNAVCHDPKIPLIDAPNQPCNEERALRCAADNRSIYQLCYNKLWSNLTCSDGNVCHDSDGEITCMSAEQASIEDRTFVLNKAEKFNPISAASSFTTSYCWIPTILLAVVVMAFGAGI